MQGRPAWEQGASPELPAASGALPCRLRAGWCQQAGENQPWRSAYWQVSLERTAPKTSQRAGRKSSPRKRPQHQQSYPKGATVVDDVGLHSAESPQAEASLWPDSLWPDSVRPDSPPLVPWRWALGSRNSKALVDRHPRRANLAIHFGDPGTAGHGVLAPLELATILPERPEPEQLARQARQVVAHGRVPVVRLLAWPKGWPQGVLPLQSVP